LLDECIMHRVHTSLYNLYNFLSLGHISPGLFFVRVCIVRVVIGLIAKYHLDF